MQHVLWSVTLTADIHPLWWFFNHYSSLLFDLFCVFNCFFYFLRLKCNYITSLYHFFSLNFPICSSFLSASFVALVGWNLVCGTDWLWTQSHLPASDSAPEVLGSKKGMHCHAWLPLLFNHLRKRKESSPHPCQCLYILSTILRPSSLHITKKTLSRSLLTSISAMSPQFSGPNITG